MCNYPQVCQPIVEDSILWLGYQHQSLTPLNTYSIVERWKENDLYSHDLGAGEKTSVYEIRVIYKTDIK